MDAILAPVGEALDHSQTSLTRPSGPLQHEIPEILEYTGEFGPELICFLPTVFWLHQTGLLENRKVKIYSGMESFYYFIPSDQLVIKTDPRMLLQAYEQPMYLSNRHEHFSIRQPTEMFPDYRAHFADAFPLNFTKPILVIHNKYCDEWGNGPLNHINIEFLEKAISLLKSRFQIIYFRQGIKELDHTFSADHNTVLDFDDIQVFRRHPEALIFDEILDRFRGVYDYNTLKNIIYAKTYYFLSSQGGGAHHCSLFSGSLLIINHKAGEELRFAYSEGFYRYASNPAPLCMLCQSDEQLDRSIDIILHSSVVDGRVLVSPELAPMMRELAPPKIPDVPARIAELQRYFMNE